MPSANIIQFSTASLANTIKKGQAILGVNDAGYGPTTTTGFWNGITPPSGGYTIYVSRSTAGPNIYTPSSDSELITYASKLTNVPFTSVSGTLAWFATQSNSIVVNKNYPNIAVSNSNAILDASFIPSYPTTNSICYSLAEDFIINTINPASVGANRYNNPGFAGGLFIDPQTYSGSTVWRTDFIPQSASFIPRLGSTEGFGFFHAMGRPLTASNFYLASIFVSSSYPLQVSSTEGYNNTYSNISGWGTNSTTTTRVNVGGGWTRLYTLWFQNVNGFASRGTTAAATHTVNTTSTTTLIVSRSIAQSNLSDSNLLWGVIAHSPSISSNGGLTGLSILNHGLNTSSFTKAGFPSPAILSGSGFPYLYYIQLSVPSSAGVNTNITLNYNPTGYYYALTDNKFWKVTFNTSSLLVNQTASVFWAAPMIEPAYANFPSIYALRTGSIVSNGTLTNGVTWNPNGWFEFDGVDDYINISNDTNLTNPLTVCALVNTSLVTSSAQVIYGPSANGSDSWLSITDNKALLRTTQTANVNNVNLTGTTFISASRWHHIVGVVNNTTASLWVNGKNDANLSARAYIIGSWNSSARIGQRATGQFPFNGKIAQLQTYNSQLTPAQILQNYYQAPITTDGLIFALDAGNLVSYESGSATGYSLTLSGSLTRPISCSLVNGVQYKPQFQGYFDFDGTDDQVLLENTTAQSTGIRLGSGTTPWMVNAWVKTTAAGNANIGSFPVLSNRSGGPVYSNMGIGTGGVMKYAHYSGSWLIETGSIAVNNNQWHMLSWVNRNNNTLDMYVDSVFDRNVSSSIVGGGNINPVDIIGASFGGYLDADIAFLSINIRSTLYTAGDVTQNFNAQRTRFGV
jgi:hypothetical protein